MSKLYFEYGTMGSSKTAQALIKRFQLIEHGKSVYFIKPAIDTRDGANVIKSRIGIEAPVDLINTNTTISQYLMTKPAIPDVIIVDEAQFLSAKQIEGLRNAVDLLDIDVYCFGLRTDFMSMLFSGARRLFEIADEIHEIKTICDCGKDATVNARFFDASSDGSQIQIGGNERYKSMCYNCWVKSRKNQNFELI